LNLKEGSYFWGEVGYFWGKATLGAWLFGVAGAPKRRSNPTGSELLLVGLGCRVMLVDRVLPNRLGVFCT
jgi:hypothetical protein